MKTNSKNIEMIKKGICVAPFYHMVNSHYVENYVEKAKVHVVEDEDDMDTELSGWNLWIIENCPYIVLTVNNEFGFDYHCLTADEKNKLFAFYKSITK